EAVHYPLPTRGRGTEGGSSEISAADSPRRRVREGTQEAHAHKSLQPTPHVARQYPQTPRHRRRGGLRLAGGFGRGGDSRAVAGAESGAGERVGEFLRNSRLLAEVPLLTCSAV